MIREISHKFSSFDVHEIKARDFEGFPTTDDNGQSNHPFEIAIQNNLSYKKPKFPEAKMKAHMKVSTDLPFVDVVRSVLLAWVARVGKEMRTKQAARRSVFEDMGREICRERSNRCVQIMAALQAANVATLENLSIDALRDWTRETILSSAMNGALFEISANLLGPRGPQVISLVEKAMGGRFADPTLVEALLEVTKELGETGLSQGFGLVASSLEQKCPGLRATCPELFSPKFMLVMSSSLTDGNFKDAGDMILQLGMGTASEAISDKMASMGIDQELQEELVKKSQADVFAELREMDVEGIKGFVGIEDLGVDALIRAASRKLAKYGIVVPPESIEAFKEEIIKEDIDAAFVGLFKSAVPDLFEIESQIAEVRVNVRLYSFRPSLLSQLLV